jgi:hypothetical protein
MNAPDREDLDALLEEFEALLEREGEYIRKADIAKLETCHLQKENSLAAIRARLRVRDESLCNEDFEKRDTAAGEKYRRIARRLKENLEAAVAIRDAMRKQILRLDGSSMAVQIYSKFESEAEAISVDFSW